MNITRTRCIALWALTLLTTDSLFIETGSVLAQIRETNIADEVVIEIGEEPSIIDISAFSVTIANAWVKNDEDIFDVNVNQAASTIMVKQKKPTGLKAIELSIYLSGERSEVLKVYLKPTLKTEYSVTKFVPKKEAHLSFFARLSNYFSIVPMPIWIFAGITWLVATWKVFASDDRLENPFPSVLSHIFISLILTVLPLIYLIFCHL